MHPALRPYHGLPKIINAHHTIAEGTLARLSWRASSAPALNHRSVTPSRAIFTSRTQKAVPVKIRHIVTAIILNQLFYLSSSVVHINGWRVTTLGAIERNMRKNMMHPTDINKIA